MTDPIADLLTRIRNALHARKDVVVIPSSRIKESILKILKERGLISNFIKEEGTIASLKVFLKYDAKKRPSLHHLTRISTPGGRVYRGYRDLKAGKRGLGVTILSTPQGIITDEQARATKVGGEVLCELW